MKRLFTIIQNWFKLLQIRYQMRPGQLKKAIKEADRLHNVDGKRYRVFYFGNKYHIWNRQDIRRQQAIGLLKYDKKIGNDFDEISFYDTNTKGGI